MSIVLKQILSFLTCFSFLIIWRCSVCCVDSGTGNGLTNVKRLELVFNLILTKNPTFLNQLHPKIYPLFIGVVPYLLASDLPPTVVESSSPAVVSRQACLSRLLIVHLRRVVRPSIHPPVRNSIHTNPCGGFLSCSSLVG